MTGAASAVAAVGAVGRRPRARSAGVTRCVQCLLPIRGRPLRLGPEREPFCCYGCYLVLGVTRDRGAAGAAQAIFLRLGLAAFFAMNAMMFSLAGYFPYVYGMAGEGTAFVALLRLVALVLTVPVVALLGIPIIWRAAHDASQLIVGTDALIALGAVAAFGLSIHNTLVGAEHVYFDTVAMLLLLVALGRYLEARAKAETAALLADATAESTAPVRVARPDGEVSLPPDEIDIDDIVCLAPGTTCPVDGVIVQGRAHFGEATLTGETRPVFKDLGAEVIAGSSALDGHVRVQASRVGAGSTLGLLRHAVEEALADRSGLQRVADRLASIFTPVVMALAVATGVYWWQLAGPDRALLTSLSVLVVACPCAFGIATPAAVWIGVSEAARRRILLGRTDVLEALARVRKIWFDRTGTLTVGHLTLAGVIQPPETRDDGASLLTVAQALGSGIPHPIALSLDADGSQGGAGLAAAEVRYQAGLGVEGVVSGERWFFGSLRFFRSSGGREAAWVVEALRGATARGALASVLWCGMPDGSPPQVRAVLWFIDRERPQVAAICRQLRCLGLEVGILSGARVDRWHDGQAPIVAESYWDLDPQDKVFHIAAARQTGPVAMVGDGLNDAPALAAADIGIAFGAGTDLTREAAAVNIVSGDLEAVPWLVAWARTVRRAVHRNLAWAFGYNGVAIAAAAAGWLNPVLAALIMIVSSLAIVTNTRRLRRQADRCLTALSE